MVLNGEIKWIDVQHLHAADICCSLSRLWHNTKSDERILKPGSEINGLTTICLAKYQVRVSLNVKVPLLLLSRKHTSDTHYILEKKNNNKQRKL